MYQISNEKFGTFLMKIRKEKSLTQKELSKLLFVSDKTVSKWERGASIPSVALLIPLADTLGVTVTELLKGEYQKDDLIPASNNAENTAVKPLELAVHSTLRKHKRNWIGAYLLCLILTAAEIALLAASGISLSKLSDNVLLACALMLLFGGWFCLFAKELLPKYYDENKINYYTEGIFRMHLAGLSFNNGNWPYICTALKAWTLSAAVLYPLICYGIVILADISLWNDIKNYLSLAVFAGMFITVYIVGKKYE